MSTSPPRPVRFGNGAACFRRSNGNVTFCGGRGREDGDCLMGTDDPLTVDMLRLALQVGAGPRAPVIRRKAT